MTLTIQDLGALGELLGSIAVLVTLVYLALQTRQNTMAITAQLDAAQVSLAQNNMLANATSPVIQEAMAEDRISDMTINEHSRNAAWAAELFSYQWQFQQSKRGLLASFNPSTVAGRMDDFFTNYRSFPGWWARVKKSRIDPEFVEWVEEQRSKAA